MCDIVELDAFRVVAFPGNEDDPTKFWNRYNVNGLSSRLSGGLYGVFKTPPATHIDFVSTIGKTWDYIRDVWRPQSRYERRRDYEFERYVEESRLFFETIFVPVRIKNK